MTQWFRRGIDDGMHERGRQMATRETPRCGCAHSQTALREELSRAHGVAERLVRPTMSGNANGGKEPVQDRRRKRREPGDWET